MQEFAQVDPSTGQSQAHRRAFSYHFQPKAVRAQGKLNRFGRNANSFNKVSIPGGPFDPMIKNVPLNLAESGFYQTSKKFIQRNPMT